MNLTLRHSLSTGLLSEKHSQPEQLTLISSALSYATDVTPFIGPGRMRVGFMRQLFELPPGAYAPGGPNGA